MDQSSDGNGSSAADTVDIEAMQQDTVSGLVENRKAFTAYDITSAIRGLGIQTPKHDDMKEIVHQMFADARMADYKKELVQFKSAPIPCWLYHPPEVDPRKHASGLTQDSQAAAVTSDVKDDAASLAAPATPQADGSVLKTIGNQPGSVLYIPRDFADKVGIQAKGPAYMTIMANNEIVVSSAQAAETTHVDRNQNIRIGRTALLKAGLNGQVKIEVDGQTIKISRG